MYIVVLVGAVDNGEKENEAAYLLLIGLLFGFYPYMQGRSFCQQAGISMWTNFEELLMNPHFLWRLPDMGR